MYSSACGDYTMRTFKGICLADHVISEGDQSLSLVRGREYTISPPGEGGTVTVFSTFWASGVPAALFGGLVPGPGDSHD